MKKDPTSDVHRRTFLKASGVGALSVLAGCSSSGSDGDNSRGGGSGSGRSNGNDGDNGSRGTRTNRGMRSIANSRGLNPVIIGYLGPLSSDIGKAGYRGARIAVGEVNSNGGILRKIVTLLKADTQNNPSQARSAVDRLIKHEGVDMLLGVFSSEVALEIEDQVAKAGIPLLVSGAASPKISTAKMGKNYEKYKRVFRVSPVNSDYQAQALAEYGKFLNNQHGWRKFAVVAEDALWTEPITARTSKRLKKHGLEVTMTERFAPNTRDFTPLLDRVKRSGADVLLKAIGHVSGAAMLSTWQQKYPFAQEGINVASMSPQYWKDTDGGCLYETTAGPSGVASITSKSEPFTERYIKYSRSRPTLPMYMGVGSYDAAHVGMSAITAIGSLKKLRNNDDIISYWLSRTSMKGASGHIEFFGKNGMYPNDVKYGLNKVPFVVNQWQPANNGNGLAGTGGTKTVVWPKKYATGNHVAPPWL